MSCMHNYRAAAGLYLLLLNAKVKLFPAPAGGKKQRISSVLLHCCIIDLMQFFIDSNHFFFRSRAGRGLAPSWYEY